MKREQKEATSALVKLSRQYGLEESKLVDTLRATVIKPKKIRGKDGKPDSYVEATMSEVNAFLMVAAQYDLDPLLKQIHAFVSEQGGGIVPIVGYDGWVKLVNREKRFAGVEFIDHLDEKNNLYAITGKMSVWNDPGGNPEQGSRTVEVTEYLEECRGTTTPWVKWPRRMLRNKVYSQTARMAFGFSGIYDEDEGDRIIEAGEAIDVTPTKIPQALPSSTTSGAPKGQNPGKTEDTKTAQDAPGSTISGSPSGSAATAGDLATGPASPAPATGAADTPKTDSEKKAYILAVAEKAVEMERREGRELSVAQVIFDLSKFKDKEDPNKEVGAQGIEDPRLVGRWLSKTYGEAKKLESQLGEGPF